MNASSRAWLHRQRQDPHVRAAHTDGYRSRSAYKLLELSRRYHLIGPGTLVVDLGAAPGGWSQAARNLTGSTGRIIACDLLPMPPLAHIQFVQGDFLEPAIVARIFGLLSGHKADIVLSDMSANQSGIRTRDQAAALTLAEAALQFARRVLRPGGNLVVKLFQGEGFESWIREARSTFRRTRISRAAASRKHSREQYFVAQEFFRHDPAA